MDKRGWWLYPRVRVFSRQGVGNTRGYLDQCGPIWAYVGHIEKDNGGLNLGVVIGAVIKNYVEDIEPSTLFINHSMLIHSSTL